MYLKSETRMQHSGIVQSSKHADTFTGDTVSAWLFFGKSSGGQNSSGSVQPSTKKKQKLPKLQKIGLLKLDSQDFKQSIDFPEKISTFKKKMHV
jgi:hypothetical protein